MNLSLPDMSGPPVWWDVSLLCLAALGAATLVLRHLHSHATKEIA